MAKKPIKTNKKDKSKELKEYKKNDVFQNYNVFFEIKIQINY